MPEKGSVNLGLYPSFLHIIQNVILTFARPFMEFGQTEGGYKYDKCLVPPLSQPATFNPCNFLKKPSK